MVQILPVFTLSPFVYLIGMSKGLTHLSIVKKFTHYEHLLQSSTFVQMFGSTLRNLAYPIYKKSGEGHHSPGML